MAVWKNRVAADPTLEENDNNDKKSKRGEKTTPVRPLPIWHTRCWDCGERLSVQYDEDPDAAIDVHRKTNCRRAIRSSSK